MPGWYDDLLSAIENGEPQYLRCTECEHATLPPRQVCPSCGQQALEEAPLSDTGWVQSYTEITVTTPKFHGEAPYTVVLAEFTEGVSLTGQLHGATAEDITVGDQVRLSVERREEQPGIISFHPVAYP